MLKHWVSKLSKNLSITFISKLPYWLIRKKILRNQDNHVANISSTIPPWYWSEDKTKTNQSIKRTKTKKKTKNHPIPKIVETLKITVRIFLKYLIVCSFLHLKANYPNSRKSRKSLSTKLFHSCPFGNNDRRGQTSILHGLTDWL